MKNHLIQLIELFEKCNDVKIFLLETNGLLFGIDKDFIKGQVTD